MSSPDVKTSPVSKESEEDTMLAGPPEPDREEVRAGERFGRFALLEEVGRGGMGRVVRAYDSRLRREVAIKLVRTRAGDAVARALREAQALAQLNHPNVVAVYDAGQIAGELFIAMEYVQGATLRKWLESERSPDEILQAFRDAGRGLAAAHRAGLVHRDFKPDNVLLGDDGRVRVVDFGLARADRSGDSGPPVAIDAPSDESSPRVEDDLTEAGIVLGTPAYMAPEQHDGRPADARTDQYAFCVTLFEALHGYRPFRGALAEIATAKATRAIEAPPPRSRTAPAWADELVLRGLEPAPDARWPSMDALLDALERGMGRARRWRWIVGATILAIGVFAVAVANELSLGRRTAECERAGESIRDVWNDAARTRVHEAIVATGVHGAGTTADKAVAWFDRRTDAWRQARTDACMAADVHERWDRGTYDRALWCLDERRLEIAALVDELGHAQRRGALRAVRAIAEMQSVGPCLDLALLSRLPLPPAEERDVIREIREDIVHARTTGAAGDLSTGLVKAREALQRATDVDAPAVRATAEYTIGIILRDLGEYEDSARSFEDAFFDAAISGAHESRAKAAIELTHTVGSSLARPADARVWQRHAEVALADMGEVDGVLTADHLSYAALLASGAGNFEEARALHERALAIREELFGPDHPAVATTFNNLAVIAAQTGRFPEALALIERSLAIEEEAYGVDHIAVAMSVNNLAGVHLVMGNVVEAKAANLRALRIRENALGPDHPETARSLDNLARAHIGLGELEEARPLIERSLAIRERVYGEEHPDVALSLGNKAELLEQLGKDEEARVILERALAIRERVHGPDHVEVAIVLDDLGEVLRRLGDLDRAEALHRRSLPIRERVAGPTDTSTTWALAGLAEIAIARHRGDEAVALAERTVEIRDDDGASAVDRANARRLLARALTEAGRDPMRAQALVDDAERISPAAGK